MKKFSRLVQIVRRLRSPQGCRWDRAQKVSNLKTYLLEETYELIDALNDNSLSKIKEELGDLFLLLVFIVEILEEKGKLSIEEVLSGINRKLVLRHPHVFSRKSLKSKEEILKFWISEKARVKRRKTLKERLPKVAPSLLLAYLLTKEKKHINRVVHPDELILKIRRLSEQLSPTRRDRKVISELAMAISYLAPLWGVDLENSLRKMIMKEAGNIRYNHERKEEGEK